MLDRVYRGGTAGDTRDDPLSKLLRVGNQGGFRPAGSVMQDSADACRAAYWQRPQIKTGHTTRTPIQRKAVLLATRWPARGHRVWAALRASLRDAFASLDPATTRKDSAPAGKDGANQWSALAKRQVRATGSARRLAPPPPAAAPTKRHRKAITASTRPAMIREDPQSDLSLHDYLGHARRVKAGPLRGRCASHDLDAPLMRPLCVAVRAYEFTLVYLGLQSFQAYWSACKGSNCAVFVLAKMVELHNMRRVANAAVRARCAALYLRNEFAVPLPCFLPVDRCTSLHRARVAVVVTARGGTAVRYPNVWHTGSRCIGHGPFRGMIFLSKHGSENPLRSFWTRRRVKYLAGTSKVAQIHWSRTAIPEVSTSQSPSKPKGGRSGGTCDHGPHAATGTGAALAPGRRRPAPAVQRRGMGAWRAATGRGRAGAALWRGPEHCHQGTTSPR